MLSGLIDLENRSQNTLLYHS